ncbi:hypothetical protein [Actinomycetospora termitidis]|uniref:Uncharacterized protein n=1 Tax=Actinomycetospora termitidis TaxID=3053470 RepID=A0ABT7MB03_9PSEU|nr:hypothetical protein [Actinomycetospora sp. Odt1-22]MDL5157851.1 hypothetical protein [Actinomycetospora sp. Odt1-22]
MRFSLRSGRHSVGHPRTPEPVARDPHPSGPLPVVPTPDPRLVDDAPATVEVVASRSTARLLTDVAPTSWRIVATDRPSHHPCVDFVVLVDPEPEQVVDVLDRQPGAEVVVLLGRHAPTDRLVAMLDAGVSICLRESPARLVAGHMVARRRRGHGAARGR